MDGAPARFACGGAEPKAERFKNLRGPRAACSVGLGARPPEARAEPGGRSEWRLAIGMSPRSATAGVDGPSAGARLGRPGRRLLGPRSGGGGRWLGRSCLLRRLLGRVGRLGPR